MALAPFLPGPARSQVGIALGLLRGGVRVSLAAWGGFTRPSALVMTLFALGPAGRRDSVDLGLLHGLKVAAVTVVAQAVWSMARAASRSSPPSGPRS